MLGRFYSRSIKTKVMVLIATLLILSQTVSFLMSVVQIRQSKHHDIQQAFSRVEQLFDTLILNKMQNLKHSALLMGSLPVLVAVVENGDARTIQDSASDYQQTLQISTFDVFDADGEFMAGLGEGAVSGGDLVTRALDEEHPTSYGVRDGKLYIFAADVIGLSNDISGALLIGSEIDDVFARKIKDLTQFEAGFIVDGKLVASSLRGNQRQHFEQSLGMLTSQASEGYLDFDGFRAKVVPVKDAKGSMVGEIVLMASLKEISALFNQLLALASLATLLVFGFFLLVGSSFSKTLTEPIVRLQRSAKEIVSTLNYSIRTSVVGRDEIAGLATGFNQLLDEIEKNHRKLEEYNRTLEDKVEERTQALSESNSRITALVENLSEGFITFGRDGVVQSGGTKAAEALFGCQPEGKAFTDLVADGDETKIASINQWIEMLYEHSATMGFHMLTNIGPESIENHNGDFIKLSYRPIYADDAQSLSRIICIAADKTKERDLKLQSEQEKATVKLVLSILRDKAAFIDFVAEFRRLSCAMAEHLNDGAEIDIGMLLRTIHTIKGGAGLYHLLDVAQLAHELEDQLGALREQTVSAMQKDDLQNHLQGISHAFQSTIERHAATLGALDGEASIDRTISKSQIESVHDLLVRELSLESPALRRFVDLFILEDLSHSFQRYERVVDKLATDQEKKVCWSVRPSEVFVEASRYKSLIGAAVHLFRNAVDHGIESPDERLEAGKEAEAKLELIVERSGDRVKIVLSDDGRGIDTSRVAQVAEKRGVKSRAELEAMSDAEINQLIFHPGFSTSDAVTSVSGRGVGLDALMKEAQALDGSVKVHSDPGAGTQFCIDVAYFGYQSYRQSSNLSDLPTAS